MVYFGVVLYEVKGHKASVISLVSGTSPCNASLCKDHGCARAEVNDGFGPELSLYPELKLAELENV